MGRRQGEGVNRERAAPRAPVVVTARIGRTLQTLPLLRGLVAGAALAADAAAAADRVTISLAAADRFCEVGGPARVRLEIANAGPASLLTSNSVLFGVGFEVTTADGTARKVPESAAPSNARQPLLLPAGSRVATTVDLAPLLPSVFGRRGKVTIGLEVAGAKAAPLELEIHPDWRGWRAVIETSLGEMELELFPEKAPITVANFLELAEAGFYDGLTFHRVVKDFMIQGGCPRGDGTGDGPRKLPLEASRGEGAVRHERGTISMAHRADPNSGSCQFFLCHRDQPALDGSYSAFGRIARGLETLDRITELPCSMVPGGPDAVPSRPKERVTIVRIRPMGPEGGNGGG
jgi:cyclophilin family peptidyl-prolyl cis-trans isomerase